MPGCPEGVGGYTQANAPASSASSACMDDCDISNGNVLGENGPIPKHSPAQLPLPAADCVYVGHNSSRLCGDVNRVGFGKDGGSL